MSLDQKIQEIDQQIAERVRRAVQDEFEALAGRLPTSYLETSTLAAAAGEGAQESRAQALGEVVRAARSLDRQSTQAGVLSALLEESGRYASRAILFLTRSDGAAGWGSRGFGDAAGDISSLTLATDEDDAWSTVTAGRAPVSLDAAGCAGLCSRLESPVPRRGLLVPLVLRDQLAAVLYADELEQGDDPELSAEGLQALVYLAALAIETLPFRERESTPTLAEAAAPDAVAEEAPALPLWGAAPAVAPPVVEDESAEPPEPDEVDDEEGEDETLVGGVAAREAEEPDEAPEAAAEEPAEPAYAAALEEVDLDEVEVEEIEVDEVEVEEIEVSAEVVEEDIPDETEALPADDLAHEAALETAVALPEEEIEEEADAAAEASVWEVDETSPTAVVRTSEADDDSQPDEASLEASPFDTAGDLPTEPLSSPPPAAEADEAQEAAEMDAEVETEDPAPAAPAQSFQPENVDVHEDATVLLPPRPGSAFGGAPVAGAPAGHETILVRPGQTPSPQPPPPAPPAPSGGGAQVAPPSDVEGPGWAFGGKAASEEDARHEEARRLARLLVNEIKLYNQEEVDAGRRNNDIYQRLREDIDRSRQMYEERVEEPLRSSTDYFYQELVNELAGGDPKALGV